MLKASMLSSAAGAILMLLAASPAAAAGGAYVRVNLGGYVTAASKRAYLMSPSPETGATFKVINSSGTAVYSASPGASAGAWGSFPDVYPLDFDSVTAAGTYTISVSGPIAAASPSFRIDTAANLYSAPIANTLSFYENERDGPNFIPSALRTAAGHLNDENATVYLTPAFNKNGDSGPLTPAGGTIDAAGGWWDAGDYMKFVETHSYTVAMMLAGIRDFPNQMGSGSTTSNFTAEAQFGLDWLQEMWDDTSQTLYYQVAVASGGNNYIGDHDIWRLPQVDDAYMGCGSPYEYICHRPVFINTAGATGASVSPNLAGRLAADFALCYQVFKSSDAAYANQCLLAAEHVFDLADTTPSGKLLTTAPYSFYPEVEWRDDLELGATELYFAIQPGGLPRGLPHTNPNYYLTAAAKWANAYISSPNAGETLNLYDVSGLAHYELYRALALAGNPNGTGLATNQAALLANLEKELNAAVTQAGTDPFGFGIPWNQYDTTSYGGGLVVMANEYTYLTGTSTYTTYGNRWMANILGANAWGTSLITGEGSLFPYCMQHQVANIVGSTNGTPPFLAGAAVEGPNSYASKGYLPGMVTCPPGGGDVFAPFNGNGAVYKDNVQSYSTVEPAIDLTSTSFLAFSWQIAGAPSGTP